MSNLKRFIGILIAFAFGAICVFCGTAYGQKTSEPKIKYVEVPVEVPVLRTANHYIIEEKKIVVEKPVELRGFASLKELKEWLANDNTDAIHLIFGGEEGLRVAPNFQDCDDYAYALQKATEQDGYQMSIQIDTRKHHALNSAFIGNNIYFIEPQTDKVWLECYRDKVEAKDGHLGSK